MIKNSTYYRNKYLAKESKPYCIVNECKNHRNYGYKYCNMHLVRIKRTGDPKVSWIEIRDKNFHDCLRSLGNKPRKGKVLKCYKCNKDFYVSPEEIKRRKYCSRICQFESKKTNEPRKCLICKNEYYVAKSTMKYRPKKTCSDKCSRVLLGRIKRGNKSTFWNGGRSSKRRRIRASVRIKEWREKVFKRDDYVCQKCFNVGGYLQAHHIKPFAQYPRQRFVIKNGMTLCRECHKNIHKEWLGGKIDETTTA